MKNYLSEEREKNASQALDDIITLESYLKVARDQGWIENVNF
mgnify:CR=1 FL=1